MSQRHDKLSDAAVAEVARQFEGMLSLESGWDGHDGRPIAPQTFDYALNLLVRLEPAATRVRPQMVPLPHGGIQVEWHTRAGDLEIEMEGPGAARYFFEDARTGAVAEGDAEADLARLPDLLKGL